MMNEGEKKKKIYKRGDVVTFRLLKKQKYNDDVLDLLNEANRTDTLNLEIIEALKIYCKFKNGTLKENIIDDISTDTDEEDIYNNEPCSMSTISTDEDEIFGFVKKQQANEPVDSYNENKNKIVNMEEYSLLEKNDAAEELFEEHKQEDEEKSGLNRAFKKLRRNF